VVLQKKVARIVVLFGWKKIAVRALPLGGHVPIISKGVVLLPLAKETLGSGSVIRF
jgi:hypothetical protein